MQLTQLRLQLPADTQWRWSCCACRHSAVSMMSSYSPVVLTTCTVLTAPSLWVHRRLSSLTLTLSDCDVKESVERMLIAAVQRVWSTEWNSSWKNVTEWLKMRTIWHQRSVRFLLCFAILRHIHTLYLGLPRWAGKTSLDFTEARHSEWQWHQLGHMQVCTSLQTENHPTT